jgi:biotin carboxyl carrier protein
MAKPGMKTMSKQSHDLEGLYAPEFESKLAPRFKSFLGYTQRPPFMASIKYIGVIFILLCIFFALTPWYQTSRGNGKVIAFDPNERQTQITALVSGRIKAWHVIDGEVVEEGQKLVEIIDNDPEFIDRLIKERDSIKNQYMSLKLVAQTAKLNFDRQRRLFQDGISSRKAFEDAKIKLEELKAKESQAYAKLNQVEVKLSRQNTQLITAPADGAVYISQFSSLSARVKEGDPIATFIPDLTHPAVQMYIDPNDMPLVYPGRQVRLQFEGWPAVQFSGWPSRAIFTFSGVVSVVDQFVSDNGKLRIIVTPDENEDDWPDSQFLRVGAQATGWVILNRVTVGYEIWRQLNDFPPLQDKTVKVPKKKPIKVKLK